MGNRTKALKKLLSYIVSFCMVLSAMLLAVPQVQAQTTGMINVVSAAGGNYYEGNTVSVFVYFNEPVAVTGVPYIETNVGTSVYYKAGDGTSTLEFSGVIAKIQTPRLLNYISQNSLRLDPGSYIKSIASGLDMNLILPDTQAGNSLGGSNVNLIPSGPTTLTGTIEAPTGTVLNNVYYNVDVYSSDDMGKRFFEYNVFLKGNNNFQLGGFAPNKNYIISARCFDSNNKFLMQGEMKIAADGNGIPSPNYIVIKLMEPQIKVIVNTPNGNLYTLNYPNIRIENTNGTWMNNYPLISSSENGKCEVYGLADGEYYMWAEPSGKDYGKSAQTIIRVQGGVLTDVNGAPAVSNICELKLTTPQIVGKVTAPGGVTLQEGCRIDITGNNFKYNGAGTNSVGEYNVSGIPDGDYTIRAIPNNSSSYAVSNPQKITIQNGVLAAVNGSPVTGNTCDIQLNTPSLIGTIEIPAGTEFTNLNYGIDISSVDSIDEHYFEYGMFLENNVNFKLAGFEPSKTYTISARAFDKSTNQLIMQGEIQIATDEYGNLPVSNIVVKLKEPQIKCTVRTPNGEIYNSGYPNIRIEKPDVKWKDNYPMITSIRSGEYDVYDLADGDYYMWAESFGKDYGSSLKTPIKIQNGVVTDVYGIPLASNVFELTLRAPQVVGTVKSSDGGPLQGWCDINVFDSMGNFYGTGTNEFGEYNLTDLADGDYTIRAIPNGYSASNYAPSKAKTITITNGVLSAENSSPSAGSICDLQLSVPTLAGTIEASTGEVLTDVNYNVDVCSVDSLGNKHFEYGTFLQDNKTFKLGNFEPNKTYIISARCFSSVSQRFMQGEVQITTDEFGNLSTKDIVIKVADFIFGDINRDRSVTAEDAMLILQNAAGLITLTDEQKKLADVNGDGMVTAGDATLILRYAQKLITGFPIDVK